MKKIYIFLVAVSILIFLNSGNVFGTENLSIRVLGPSTANPGGDITYTIIYLNAGDTKAQNVEIVQSLPSGNYTYVSSSPQGTYSSTNNTITWNKSTTGMSFLESLGAGAHSIQVTVKAGVKGGTPGFASAFTPNGYFINPNPATLLSSATIKSDLNTTGTISNIISTNVTQICSALLNIAAGSIKSSTGTPVVYLVQVINSGNIYNKFDLAATNYPCGVLSFDPLTWRFLDINGNVITNTDWIAPGQSFLVLFEVSCPPGSNPGKYSCHTVTATSEVCNSVSAIENTQTLIVPSPKEAMVLLSKAGSNDIVQSGDTLIYTLYAFNSNNAYPANNLTITDVLPPNVTYIKNTVVQQNSTITSNTYDSGTKTLTLNFSSLTYGTSNAIRINVYTLVNSLGGTCDGSFSNTASATYTGASALVTSIKTTTITNKPDLKITKKAESTPNPAAPDGTIKYTLVYENIGNCTATNVNITDLYDNIHTTDGGSNTGTKSFIIGTLTAGAKDSVTYTVNIFDKSKFPDGTTTILNVATISGSEAEIDYNNNTATASVYVAILSDLKVTKTVNSEPGNILEVGKSYTYTISVVNNGDISATNVILSDTLPSGFTFVSASNGGVLSGKTITWPSIATLAVGASTTFTCTVVINISCDAIGNITNIAHASSTTNDANESDNTVYVTSLVKDTEKPTITCATPAVSYAADNGVCTYTVLGTALDPVATSDNCTIKSVVNSINNTSSLKDVVFALGTTHVMWVITDESENKDSCEQIIIVNDTQKPILTCPTTVNEVTNTACTFVGSIGTATATDNCTISGNIIITNDAPTAFPLGTTTVTWQAKDVAGNIQTETQFVIINDIEKPVAISKNITVSLSITGTVTITAADVNNNSTDNCNIQSMSVAPSTFGCTDVGSHTVTLTVTDNSGNSSTSTSTVTVTDPLAPSLSINDVTVTEGTDAQASFTVSMTNIRTCDVTFTVNTANNTALAGSDYTAKTNQTYTIPAGQTTVAVNVLIGDNVIAEPTETFFVNLSNPVNAIIADPQGIGTIIDNDATSIAINDITVSESAGTAGFTVTLTGNIQDALTVDFTTANGTAIAGSDFTASSGTLTFPAGSITGSTQAISVPIINDLLTEPTESFTVNLSNIVSTGSATINDNQGSCTITDNDAVSIAINDVSVSESAGTAVFTVTLTGNIQDVLTVNYATSNGTALAGSDYTTTSGTLTFPAGSLTGTTKTISVPILNDAIAEPTETYNVTLSSIVNNGSASISDNAGIGTITDNDAVSVAINDMSVNESAGTATFTVTLTGGIQDVLTVDYATANGTALAGSDYTATNGTLTFSAGSASGTTKIFTVAILNDAISEPTESYNINLTNIQNNSSASISDNLGVCTIIDNDAVSVAINDMSVNESAGNAVFSVTLTGNIQNVLTVNYVTSNGTALAGSDYTTTSGTVTFPANSINGATQSITIPILNDAIAEPTETFNVNLNNIQNSGSATIADNLGVGTITDNDAASVAINDVTVSEAAGTAIFTVTLTGTIQDALTVNYATSNGTALSGTDYTTTSGTLTFTAGSVSGATRTISVAIVNDVFAEPTETFNVNLSNIISTGSASISDNLGVGTITDDAVSDAVSLAINDMSVNESAGTAVFTVTLTGNVQDALTVNYATSNGTALSGSDYTSTSGTLTFPAGSLTGTTKTISVPILNDVIAEPSEIYNVILSGIVSTGTATISDNSGLGTIIDNDAASLAINDITVSEAAGTATFTVTLTGTIQDVLTINYATSNGTALAGSDYTATSGTLTFPAGSLTGATKTIAVTILNDIFAEPTEIYNVNLSNIVSTGSASISDNVGIGTITDDAVSDAVSVAINDVTVSESAGTAVFTVTLTGNIQDALTVDFGTSNVTALAGSDYTATSGTLTFNAGSLSGATKSITIPILNDIFAEPTETFNVNLSNLVNTGSASISDNLGIGTITDDAVSDAVSLAINDMSASESAGTVTFTVTLTGNIQDALTVDYATGNGTALAGSDYTATSGTLTFAAGSLTGATKTITVAIINDAFAEPTETFNVNLSALVSTGLASIADNLGIGTITDDAVSDAVSVAINDVSASEAAGTAEFTVTLTGNIQDVLTVNYATSNGTALAGSDYTTSTGTVTFPAGSLTGTTKTISVTILNDAIAEPSESFNVTLSGIVSTGSASISDNLGVGTITDNDASSVAINDVSVSESAGTATITVTLTGTIQDALTVDYATSNGTALAGSDYTTTSGTLTFPAGSLTGATKTITIPIINDAISEPTETFDINLSNILNTGSTSISDGLGVCTITDDAANDAVSIAINDVAVSESSPNAVFTVTLTGNIQDALTVDFTTSDISALVGFDYTLSIGTVTFPANSVSGATQTISVPILLDGIAEAAESYNVTLSNLVSTGSASISDAIGLGTIIDINAVSIVINDVTVSESSGTASFTVTLIGTIATNLTVDYTTSDGSALAGSDYTSTSGTVTFTPTDVTKTIIVPIIDNTISEPTELFNMNLSNVLFAGSATIDDNLGIGTILDDGVNDAVSVSINDVTVSETDGTATFTVTLAGNIQDALTVDYATSDVTALAGSDYTAKSGTVTFPANSINGATQSIVITILNNSIAEPTETFNMNLSNILSSGSASISDNIGIGTITDDAANDKVSVAINDVTVSETAGTATFTVTLTGNIQDAMTVDFATSDVTALAGSDYNATSGTVTFPANSVTGATQSIIIPIIDNQISEPTETFNVNLSNIISTGSASISDNVGIGTITDDAANDAVSVAINDVTVSETAGNAVFTVTLTGNIQDALTVDFATSNGTALAGSDYTLSAGTVTFIAGSVSGATQSITVPILNNSVAEPTETFDVNLSNIISTGTATISDNLGIGTIIDDAVNDAVSVSINDITVSETDGTATFTVTLAGNIQDAMTVDYTTSNGTALAGSDYTAKSGTVTFPANSVNGATQSIVVTILNNSIAEPTETFNMNLSNILSTGSASISDNIGIGTITDDAVNDKVSVAINDVTVSETDGNATFTVTLTGNIQDALTVDFATSNGTALAGSDYSATSGTVTFPASSVSGAIQSISVAIIDNQLSEPTETFNVNLSNITSTSSASISDFIGIGTITDDAVNDAVSVAINDVTVSETDGNAVFIVTLTGNIQDALTVDFATSNGTAMAGSDYTLSTGTVTFVAGSVSGATQNITVQILNNSVAEPTETFDVNLSNLVSTGSVSISDNIGVGTILDDAVNDAVSVAINDITVSETAGNAVFTVTLTGNIQDALTVDFITSDGTALAGSDYTATSGTVTFPANSINGAIQSITIPLIDNQNSEPTESFNVTISNILSTGSASISDDLGIGTILDDVLHDAVNVAINDITVSENAGTAVFTVTLTGNIQDKLTVDLATSDGTALAGNDYTATNGTVTFPANSISGATQSITIPIIDNLISEPTETFNVTLSNIVSTGSASISDNIGIGTITDDAINDAASLAINDVIVSETAGTAVFTMTLTGNIQDALTVDFASSDGTALAGNDYTALSGTVTFPANSISGASQNITIAILNDAISEPTETFNITLSNIVSTGSATFSDNIGIGTILDDAVNDAVNIAIDDVTVDETAGNAVFTVTLTGNIQDALTVDFATANVTAIAGSDYTTTAGTLTFVAGSVSGATQNITVPILNNSISEPTETFNVNLSNLVSTGSALISDNIGVGTILDDAVNDAVSVAINDVTVSETAGNAVFTVTLNGNIQDALTVDFATSNGTAIAGSDYIATSGTVTFLAGSISGATKTISVAIINNLITEPTEFFNVNLSNIQNTGNASISDNLGIGTITDDAANDAVSVAITDVMVNENAGTAVFIVTLTGNIQDALTMDYATSNGTALLGSDYSSVSGKVTFPAGSVSESFQTITVPIFNDVITEPTETYNVNLSNIVSTGTATISDNIGLGTIIDNDAVSLAINDVTVNENAGTALFTVTLTGNIQDALTVNYATSNGTAVAGSDYTTASGLVTFPANSVTGTTKTISITIINDAITEPTETFNVNLSNVVSTGTATISDNLGIGTITDDAINDAVKVAINDVTVNENAGTAVFTVTLTGNIQDQLTVDFATTNGTAIAGSDYSAFSGTVIFPAGSVTGATKTISVAISNDILTEPTETFTVTLSNLVSNGSASIFDATGVGTITDNDASTVAINDVTVSESAGNATFTVTLTGNIQDQLTVNFATSNGTAMAGSDYTATSGTATFAAGSVTGATKTISVPIIDNSISEPTETFNINLSSIISNGSASISDNLGIGTITDDAVNDAVSITISDASSSESSGSTSFTVTLTGNIQDALTIDYATSNGTALTDNDYSSNNGTITFPTNSVSGATKTIIVSFFNDAIAEPTETFNVTLSNLVSTGSASISDNLGIGTITDDDASSVAVNDITATEADGTATFTITLTGNIQDALTLDYATSNGTALAGSDYTTTSGTITFPANSVSGTTQSVSVIILNDIITEPTETYNLNLSNIINSGITSISDNLGIGTITDDATNDAVSVSINDVTVSETAGNAVFTVTLKGNIQDALTVDFTTSDVSATAGTDYTTISGTITFPAGSVNDATQSITVPIIDNMFTEPTETFEVVLSNIVNSGSASISDNFGIGTIIDDAATDGVSITINDVIVNEADGNAVFTVTLTGNIQDAMTIDFATANVIAEAGSDYTATSGKITFPAGSVSGATQSITVSILEDINTEATESFTVILSNIVCTGTANVTDAIGLGTIIDNDAATITIDDVTISENGGTAIFTVKVTGNVQDVLTVDYATSDVTALDGSDYTGTSGTLTFPVNTVSGATQTISVPILTDIFAEPSEMFNVNLSNLLSSGAASIGDNLGVGTITDDATNAVSVAINDVSMIENGGLAIFKVTLTGNIQDALTVDFATSDITAKAGSDYTATSGNVTFPAGSITGATQSIPVTILNDAISEPTETFNVNLSNIVSTGTASISDNVGIGTITDDAANDAVSIAINDVSVNEIDGSAVFTVTLKGNIQDALTVDFVTSDGTAKLGSDYTATSGTLTFPAFSTDGATQSITVTILNDNYAESTETYNVTLSNIASTGTATISDNLGLGTIIDDGNDATNVAIDDVTVNESAGSAVFTVTLQGNIQDALTVDFTTSNGTAIAGSDYTSTAGTITFPASSVSGATQLVTVPIVDDIISEPTENFNVTLSNIVSTGTALISDDKGLGTITDDDILTIELTAFTTTETNATQTQNFTATMSGKAQQDLILSFSTTDGTAASGSDFTAQTAMSYTIVAGSTSVSIPVDVLGDLISEATETFIGTITISNANAQQISIGTNNATATILDDDIADLLITKESDKPIVIAGTNITYTIEVENLGTNTASDVVVSDILPSGLTFVSASTVSGIWSAPTWSIGSLASGSSATLTIVATVNTDVSNGTTLSNTAVVSSSTTDPVVINNTATTSSTVNNQTDLAITKTLQTATVVMGEAIQYQIAVMNNGPSIALGVSVADTPPGVSEVEYSTDDGANWNAWTSPLAVGIMANGASVNILLKGIVNMSQCEAIVNTASVSCPNMNDPDMSNNSATSSVSAADKTKPTITCPPTVTVAADKNSCFALGVALGTPTTSDNCTVASVTNDAPAAFSIGNTTVTWTVTDGAGNTAKCTQLVTVIDDQKPIISCPATVIINIEDGSYSTIGIELGTPITGDNCTIASITNNAPEIYPLGNTEIIWTVTDESGNSASCTQLVIGPKKLFIPTGFSPNGDGVNDYFVITDIVNYPKNHIWVYNRWGNVIYEKEIYDNTWDGTQNVNGAIYGSNLPEGTYFYILDLGDDSTMYQGYVVIKR